MKTRATHPFTGARRMRPTQKHRPAIWECMLATVFACNARGDVRYFDYDWDAAREFAGVDAEGADPRVFKSDRRMNVGRAGEAVRKGQAVLYVRRDA